MYCLFSQSSLFVEPRITATVALMHFTKNLRIVTVKQMNKETVSSVELQIVLLVLRFLRLLGHHNNKNKHSSCSVTITAEEQGNGRGQCDVTGQNKWLR